MSAAATHRNATDAPHRPPPDPPFTAVPSFFALGLLSLVDAFWGDGGVDTRFAIALVCLATGFAAQLALVLTLVLRVLPRAGWIGRLVAPACALASGALLTMRLGVWTRLVGPYRTLAIATGAATIVFSVAGAALLVAVQQSSRGESGWIFRASNARQRIALAAVVLLATALTTAADHRLYVGLYPFAHLYLRISSCVLLALGLMLLVRRGPSRRFSIYGSMTVVCMAIAPLWILSGPPSITALQAFSRRPLASTLLAAARAPLDFDGDGFSAFLGGGDCDDGNAAVNPAQEEVPDNGRDDNCFGGDAHRATDIPPLKWPAVIQKSKRNLVLITIDTLRWDRLGLNDPAFGPTGKNTMPNLMRWAESATNFQRAYSSGSWTSVSLASIHRGRYPRHLRWEPHYETTGYRMVSAAQAKQLLPGEKLTHMFPLAWNDPNPTLAQLLVRQGMRTSAVVDDDFTLVLARSLGTSRGFQLYREVQPGAAVRVRSDDARTAAIAIAQVQSIRRIGLPFFLWVHFFGPHGPSSFHPDTPKDADTDTGRYDHEVRYVDEQLGLLLDALESDRDDTAVFITSDHGEELKGSYRAHGTSLDESLLRVPLVAKVPGWPTGNFEGLVSLVDLMPTFLRLADAGLPDGLDGKDLATLLGRPAQHRILISDNWRFDAQGRPLANSAAVYDGQEKLELNRLTHTFLHYIQQLPGDRPSLEFSGPQDPLGLILRQYLETATM